MMRPVHKNDGAWDFFVLFFNDYIYDQKNECKVCTHSRFKRFRTIGEEL